MRTSILKILKKKDNIPIWFMRQAGRYLPEYNEIRLKNPNFIKLCLTPKLASQITIQPLTRFSLDIAIIFSDILILPYLLGWQVEFEKTHGPKLRIFESEQDLISINKDFSDEINNLYEAITLTKSLLNKEQSIIGFAGAPWTIMTYMIEGKSKTDFIKSKKFILNNPDLSHKLVELLTEKTIDYLLGQVKAGADLLQIFDSWAGILSISEYKKFVIEPTNKIISNIKNIYPNIPIIGFPRGSGFLYENYINSIKNLDCISVDQFITTEKIKQWQQNIVVQGNLDPVVLLTNKDIIENKTKDILSNVNLENFIFNLGHGVIKSTPVENIEFLVNYVKEYKS
ncbi:uroporphyrinogen decarboxylase [Rickettsia endosymbiont of Cardiosporidium cionae]|uniref:uroporphyrinogen decarboxylase n=1 Tax=Rickettsia endosymbiont of Cardiosporidium cionae TaxID=2777155 RepID=UPI001895C560|nr:uroporphyrinogen decarboxylase [Rickettsia endosymbiont of Cardiosporidium cionae]KAF8818349.1 uroporphyrinogen decarboxylase [Rickettsia endosymbiont of Cardiosporidium cionae]